MAQLIMDTYQTKLEQKRKENNILPSTSTPAPTATQREATKSEEANQRYTNLLFGLQQRYLNAHSEIASIKRWMNSLGRRPDQQATAQNKINALEITKSNLAREIQMAISQNRNSRYAKVKSRATTHYNNRVWKNVLGLKI